MWVIGVVLFLVFLGSFALTGLQVLRDPDCATVTFGMHGHVGKTFLLQATCHQSSDHAAFAMNSAIAGTLMLLPLVFVVGMFLLVVIGAAKSA
jgi:hypothetical protein